MSDLNLFHKLSPNKAQQAISTLMTGEPPMLEIVDLMSIGLERDLRTFEREYFCPSSFLVSPETAGSTFKIVEAYYGGGKTHYLRAVERTAHRNGFATAFINLKKDECPLARFDLIYASVAEALSVQHGDQNSPVRGMGAVIRCWIDQIRQRSEDPIVAVNDQIDTVGDLPLASLKVAFRNAALAYASGDIESFDESLVYLTSGKIPAGLKKRGVLQPIDAKNGSLALRSMAALVRKLGYAGFVLILDEGDRSLSLSTAKEKMAASNNLVQIINETATEGAWPGTMLLYSIPSWQSFSEAFSNNQALIQRTESTGFPSIPPAPRIVLDNRQGTQEEKREFCLKVAERLNMLFRTFKPNELPNEESLSTCARIIADQVLKRETESTFRRLFVQSYLAALYTIIDQGEISQSDIEYIVSRETSRVAKLGM